MMLTAVYAVSDKRKTISIAGLLSLASIIFLCLDLTIENFTIQVIKHLATSAFLGYTTILILIFTFHTHRVTFNTICASLCVYILLAILWSQFYQLLLTISPESFSLGSAKPAAENSVISIYFSFVTITTLGYGDILPISTSARILSVMEALVGQLYLVVLVSRLVGLHIAHSNNS